MGDHGDIGEPKGELWDNVLKHGGHAKDDLWPPDSESDARALGTEWGKAAGALRNAIEVSNGVANGVRSAWPDPNGYAMYDNIVSVNNGDAQGKGGIKEIPPAMDGLGEAYKGYGEIVEFVKTQISETISYNNVIYSHLDDGGAYLNPLGGYAQEIFAKAVAKNIADLVKTAASRISNPHSGSTRRPEIPNPGLVGGVLDTIGSLVRGMGELIGYGEDDFGGASWSWSNAVLAWGGMAKLGAAVQAYTHGLGYVDLTTGLPGGKRGELGSTLVDFGKNFVRWNEWSKDPAHAAGGLGVNVASVVGLRGVGAGIRVAGTGLSRVGSATVKAADLSRVGDLTAARLGNAVGRFGDGMSRFGNDLTKVPTVTELAIKNTPRAIDAVRNFGKVDHEIPHITAHTAARVLENPLGPLPGTVGDNLGKNANLTPHPPATPPHDPGVVRGPGNSPHDPNTRGGDNGGQQFPPSTRQLDPPTQRPVVEPAHPSGPAEPLRPLEQRPPSGPEGGPPHPPSHPVAPGDTGLTPGQGVTHSDPAAGVAERGGAAGHPVNEGSPVKAGQPPASPFGTVGLHELARGELGQAGIAGVAEARASGRWKGEPGPDAPPGAPREPGKQGPQGPPGQGGPERPVKPQGKEENGQPPAQPLAPKGGDNGRLDSQTSLGAKEHERASGDSEHRGDRVGEEGPPAREEQPSKSPSDVLALADLARGELGEAGHGGIAEARASGQWGDPEPGPRRPGDSPDSPDEGPVNPDETTRGGRPRSPDPVLPDQGAATPHEADKGGGVATAVRPEPQDPMPASHGAPSRAPAVTEQQPAARPARSSSSEPSPQPVHGAALAERAKVADVIAGAAKPELRPEAQPLTVWPHPAEIPADDPGRLYRVTDPVRPAIGFPPQPTIGSPVPPAVGFPSQPAVGFPRPPAEVPSSPDRTAIPVRPTAPSQPAHPEPPNPGPGPEWPLELPAWPDHAADPVAPLTPGGPERPGPEMVPPPPEPAFTTHPVKPVPIELPLRPDQAFPPGPAKNPPWPGAPATSPIPYVPTHPEPVVPEWPVELPPRQDQATGTGPSEFPTPPAGLPPEVWDALTEAEREALVALSALSGVNAARILERIVTEAAAANGIGKNASLSERLASLTNAQRPAIGERLTEILGRRPVRPRPATEDKPEPEFHIQGSPEVLFFPYTISLNSDMIAAYRTYDKAVQEFHELQEQFLWAAQFLPREEFEELLRAGEDWAQLKERLRNLRDNVLAALAAAWELGARNPEELA
ncbi:MAG: hypothetical protein QOE93_417, partial [Actinomycetota bacterium]|nr:hypothetical protein [Actinomycetota bacterium]